ncbi:thiamine-phosphate kinase [Vibrio sp. 10N.286.49.B3]|uniref:thiamine-phosphate kinase n=1 Tax=Vibrio sp. 10N.286.49.B3 TaxID=1880855 RepID=UPI000C8235C4|nr:thiamine-phosphate kinase [Vibrio sp. 10N.286.49.B3]PMH41119.1 thiamine-phosphate kinase [Vibrio sp. 10N.286.49.B3]
MPGEFNLIDKYFCQRQQQRKDVILAAGDDCALVTAPENVHIAISTDTLVAGTHFLLDANPAWVAHKALASNLSDLAAMGATPAWVSLALTMPTPDEAWLAPFCDAFFALADTFGIQLIGGDTTKGPLSITLTVQGFVPKDQALRRNGAQVGDLIYVSGNLGDSKAGLEVILDSENSQKVGALELEQRHYQSTPRIHLGEALRTMASSAIDISDGVISDLTHILKCSNVGARLDVSQLPLSEALLSYSDDLITAQQFALTSGEEYELCFTVPSQCQAKIEQWSREGKTHNVTCIGIITSSNQLELHNKGAAINWDLTGYDHFKEPA